jgi:hypothetical protein
MVRQSCVEKCLCLPGQKAGRVVEASPLVSRSGTQIVPALKIPPPGFLLPPVLSHGVGRLPRLPARRTRFLAGACESKRRICFAPAATNRGHSSGRKEACRNRDAKRRSGDSPIASATI